MSETNLIRLKAFSTNRYRSTFVRYGAVFCGALAFTLFLAPRATAAFITPYALNNFKLTNTATCGGDILTGSATTPDNGVSVVLTGSNSGSGCAATTDLLTTAQSAGTVQFKYAYSSLDAPGADFAGYLLGATFTQLADTNGQSGAAMFAVNSGQSFGFRLGTQDNTGEPGILSVTSFTAPSGTAAIPEPGTMGLVSLAAGALFTRRRNRRKLA